MNVTEFSQDSAPVARTSGRWPSAAVFDCDGLLLDTAACWRVAYETVAADAGTSLEGIDLDQLNGASVAIAAARLSEALERPIAEAQLGRVLRESIETSSIAVMQGAKQLLVLLAAEMPLAVASNAPASVVEAGLRRAGLDEFFSAIVSAEQLAYPKPHPDVYLEACRRLAVDPSDAVAFEDSEMGAAAARAASLLVVAVPSARGSRLDADLTVGRLDDVRVLKLLGLESANGRSRL
jgi:HAD superfamily hydrolase (TIGR01509 family)